MRRMVLGGCVLALASGASADWLAMSWHHGRLLSIDEPTGTASILGEIGTHNANAMARGNEGRFYTVGNDGAGPDQLFFVHPARGTFTPRFSFENSVRGMAIGIRQTLFTVEFSAGPARWSLHRTIDVTDLRPAQVEIGEIDIPGLQSLAYGPDRQLYSWSQHEGLIRIHPTNADAIDVNPADSPDPTAHFMQGLSFMPDGRLIGVTPNTVWEIDPQTGAYEVLTGLDLPDGTPIPARDMRGIEWWVPSPSGAVALGLALPVVMRRRR